MLVEIDGSMGEGGGQLLRYGVALAAIMGQPIRIYNIRAKRSNPGLRPQHMHAVKLIAELVDAEVEGLRVGSCELVFKPRRRPHGGTYRVDIGTAGSISLLLQAVLPVLAAAEGEVRLTVTGGTSVKWSPPVPYLEHVLLPILSKFGLKAGIRLLRRGFYPKGGGLVEVRVSPSYPLKPVTITRYERILEISGISYVGNLPRHIAERQAAAARQALVRAGYGRYLREISVDDRTPAISRGTGIVLWAKTDQAIAGGDSLGEKGKRAEVVGEEAAQKLISTLRAGASIDEHALDNLTIYMALAGGASSVYAPRMTLHAETAVKLCEMLTGAKFEATKAGEGVELRCRGVGFSP